MIFRVPHSYKGKYKIIEKPTSFYVNRKLNNSTLQIITGDFGFYIFQDLSESRGEFLQHQWEIKEEITLHSYADNPIIVVDYMLQGAITRTLNGTQQIILEEGKEQLFYLPGDAEQKVFITPGDHSLFQVIFPQEIVQNFAAEHPYLERELKAMQEDPDVSKKLPPTAITAEEKELFQKIRSCTYTGIRRAKFMEFVLYDLLAHYLAGIENQTASEHYTQHQIKKKLQPILDYIHQNIAENLTVPKLCRMAGLPETKFRKDFKKHTGIVFKKYIRELRLSTAKKLLVETNLSVKEIAMECGFCDPPELNNQFKSAYKCTPLKFRKKERKTL